MLVLHLSVPGVRVVVVPHPHPHVVRLLVAEPVHAVGRRHHPPAMVQSGDDTGEVLTDSLLIKDGAAAVPVAAPVHQGHDPGELVRHRLLPIDDPVDQAQLSVV